MSNATDPVFPVADWGACQLPGMTKREYFAALAMQGYLAMYSGPDVTSPPADRTAQESVMYADALLAELARKAMDEPFPHGQQQPRSRESFAPVERPSPTDDAGTAGVVDSDYDGAPYCPHCGAKGAQWCSCGLIAETE
jgi:hypothetical protein